MNEEHEKIDFLSIGDISADVIIKLKDAHVHCNLDPGGCELCLRFGGKIPYESATEIFAAGNSGNAAISASRLGLRTVFMTNLGDDLNGQKCQDVLKKENITTDFVKIEAGKLTNYHYILWYDIERTILTRHEDYAYEWTDTKEASRYALPTWVYLSSLGENSLDFHKKISDYLKRHPEVKLAFQPGTFQLKMGTENLKEIYERTEVFFSNLEEAEKVLGIESTEQKDILKLVEGIANLGPKLVYLSDGPNGAYCYHDNGLWHLPAYPAGDGPIESTGAGDAFSSAIVAGLFYGLSPLEALGWGLVNSASVIQSVGSQAGLLSREKIEGRLKNTPKDYKPNKI